MPPNQTINILQAAKKIVTTGNEKNHATVLLACSGDGSKLRSMVIFKRKTVPKVEALLGVNSNKRHGLELAT